IHTFFLFLTMHVFPLLSTLFPYTTLFRSNRARLCRRYATSSRNNFLLVCAAERGSRSSRCFSTRFIDHRATSVLVECTTAEMTRSEEHTSELQSRVDLVCRLLLEKKKKTQ